MNTQNALLVFIKYLEDVGNKLVFIYMYYKNILRKLFTDQLLNSIFLFFIVIQQIKLLPWFKFIFYLIHSQR